MAIPSYMATVLGTVELTPRMLRLTVGGEGLRGFSGGRLGDERIKLLFPPEGALEPVLPLADRDGVVFAAGAERPPMRSFSVRRFDPERPALEIDMVVHDGGVAGDWLRDVRIGSRVGIAGPNGGFDPGEEADALLLAGDESALPAIASILERVPAGLPTTVLVEVGDGEDVQVLPNAERIDLRWLPRGSLSPAEGPLAAAVHAWPWPAGAVRVWAAGEAAAMKSIRRYLRDERRLDRATFQVSGYWRHRLSEEEALAAHHAGVEAATAAGASPAEIEDAGVY